MPQSKSTLNIEVESLNSFNTFYKLSYENNDSLIVEYLEESGEPFGLIGANETKNIILKVNNTSNTNAIINFNAFGGFSSNSLECVDVLSTFVAIDTIYTPKLPVSIYETILRDNTPQVDTSIDFSVTSSSINGNGLYYTDNSNYLESGNRIIILGIMFLIITFLLLIFVGKLFVVLIILQ